MSVGNISKTFYNGSAFLALSISAILVFYYAYLMPLHIDEVLEEQDGEVLMPLLGEEAA